MDGKGHRTKEIVLGEYRDPGIKRSKKSSVTSIF